MQLLEKPQSLGDINNEFLTNHGTILWEWFGIGPWSFDNYFAAHNVPNTGYWSYDSLLNNITDGSVVIFTVMNDSADIFEGFHTMAAQYVGGQFVVYNTTNSRPTPRTVDYLSEVFDGGMWIYGYIVG